MRRGGPLLTVLRRRGGGAIPDPLTYFGSRLKFFAEAASPGVSGSLLPDESGHGNDVTQADAAQQMVVKTGGYNGRTSLAGPTNASSSAYGFDFDAGFTVDRRDVTVMISACIPSYNEGTDRSFFNLGGVVDFLVGHSGYLNAKLQVFGGAGAIALTPAPNIYCGPMPVILRCGSAGIKVWAGGATPGTGAAMASGTVSGGALGFRLDPGFSIREFFAAGVVDEGDTFTDADAEVWLNWHAHRYWPIAFTKGLYVVGDSLGEGQNDTNQEGWVPYMHRLLGGSWRLMSGCTSAKSSMFFATPDTVPPGPFQRSMAEGVQGGLSPNVYIHQAGTNDLGVLARTAVQAMGDAVTCTSAMRTAGCLVGLATIVARNDGGWDPGREAERLAYNADARSRVGTDFDFLIDIDADVPESQDPNDGTYFDTDKIHWKRALHLLVGAYAAGVVAAL